MKDREVTMKEVLDFREEKASIQTKIHMDYPTGVVVSLGMNIAGPVKSGSTIFCGYSEGKKELEKAILKEGGTLAKKQVLEGKAGYAAFYLVTGVEIKRLKEVAVLLEENHPLGRLWDIDVLKDNMESVSRTEIGATKRKCLICNEDAKVCGRSRKHTVEQLQEKVFSIIKNWEESL